MNQFKINVVRELRRSMQAQTEYIEKLPYEFQEVVQDNEYANLLDTQRDLLMHALFENDYEDVVWFLYEFEAGKSPGLHIVLADKTECYFRNDADYYVYLETL